MNNESRPTTFDEIIGLDGPKEVCQTLTIAAKKRNRPIPHMLFSGPPGTGKTTLAKVMADYIQGDYFGLNGASVSIDDLQGIVSTLTRNSVLFVDEIHSLSRKVGELLYTVMEDFCYFDPSGTQQSVPQFTLIGATTQLGMMAKPFIDRFRYKAEFEAYTDEQLTEICQNVFKNNGMKIGKPLAATIARTCRGTPRLVRDQANFIRDFAIAQDRKSFTSSEVLEIIAKNGYNAFGLTKNDIRYLNLLRDGGTQSLRALESKLQIASETIHTHIEPYLLQKNLIDISTGGRTLNRNGRNLLQALSEKK